VCILVQNYYDIDIRVRRKAEALVSAGFHVDVLALRLPDSRVKNYSLNGVSVHTLGLPKRRGSLGRYLVEYAGFFMWALLKSWSLLQQEGYDLVDVNSLPDFLVFAAALAKQKGAKILFDMHEIAPEFFRSKYGVTEKSWCVRLLRRLERASFGFADHVIAINEPVRDLLASRGLQPSKCTIIMNSVDEDLLTSATGSNVAPGALARRAKFVMMYHGTLTRIYGVDIALRAFALAHEKMPDAQFWILGDGPERSSLEALSRQLGLSSKVAFISSVPPQAVGRWLRCCDVGVLATRQDVFLDYSYPNKLSEYIVMGKAVIASRLRTISHYFSNQALAFFTPNDPTDLARQMICLHNDSTLRSELVDQAQLEYRPVRWEVMKQRYLALVNELVDSEGTAKLLVESPSRHVPAGRG
jgi:glycosyltransferase involved in cell wall biosynthesis